MRIDAHQHFWRYLAADYPWIDASMGALRRDFLPGDLLPLLTAADRDGCIAVQARQDEVETRWLLELAARNPWVHGVVGHVDLCAADVRSRIAGLRTPHLVGLRHVLQAEPEAFFSREDFHRGLGCLGELGLAYDVLVHAPQLRLATELCSRFPGQRFVLDHFGKPCVRRGGHATWSHDLRAFAALPETYCKVSGLATEADWHAWTAEDLRRYFDTAVDVFTPSRLMFGSDWPVSTCAIDYRRWADLVDAWSADWSADERAGLLGGVATRVYRLPMHRSPDRDATVAKR